jgi:nitrite reductase/ring-hydroxylating ferredoxin subunit
MTMRKKKTNPLWLLFAAVSLLFFSACGDEEPQGSIPYVPVFLEINLDDLRYQNLHTGGWVYLQGGIKGIVVIKESESRYLAFERTCPYQPQDECAQVAMHSTGIYLHDDVCCGSRFDLRGQVLNGPATQGLRPYATSKNGNYLVISN